jgi:hypothetical protein
MECGHVYCSNCLQYIVEKDDKLSRCYECDEDISHNKHVVRLLTKHIEQLINCKYCSNKYQKIDGYVFACDHTCCSECVVKRSYKDISGNYAIRCGECLRTSILNGMFERDAKLRAKKDIVSAGPRTAFVPAYVPKVPKAAPIPAYVPKAAPIPAYAPKVPKAAPIPKVPTYAPKAAPIPTYAPKNTEPKIDILNSNIFTDYGCNAKSYNYDFTKQYAKQY